MRGSESTIRVGVGWLRRVGKRYRAVRMYSSVVGRITWRVDGLRRVGGREGDGRRGETPTGIGRNAHGDIEGGKGRAGVEVGAEVDWRG